MDGRAPVYDYTNLHFKIAGDQFTCKNITICSGRLGSMVGLKGLRDK